MIRTLFAMAVATLAFAAVSRTSQAVPIAPLGVSANSGQVTQVYRPGVRCYVNRYGRRVCA